MALLETSDTSLLTMWNQYRKEINGFWEHISNLSLCRTGRCLRLQRLFQKLLVGTKKVPGDLQVVCGEKVIKTLRETYCESYIYPKTCVVWGNTCYIHKELRFVSQIHMWQILWLGAFNFYSKLKHSCCLEFKIKFSFSLVAMDDYVKQLWSMNFAEYFFKIK